LEPHERAERLKHRIESFSDLVIGFSLALLALTLTIPPHFIDLITNPWWLIAYFWTFAVIAGLWYTHQRLFTHFFWPEPLTIFLNFALLSMVGLLVFFVQVLVHYHSEPDRVWAFLAYFTVFGIGFIIMGSLYLHGAWRRWDALSGEDRYIAVRAAARGIVGGTFIVAGAAISALRPARDMEDILPLAVCALGSLIGVRVAVAAVKPRIIGAQTLR
jgi:hypothetical protein